MPQSTVLNVTDPHYINRQLRTQVLVKVDYSPC